MSVVGVCKKAREGRLPSGRASSGHRIFDRADLDSYLSGRPGWECAGATQGAAVYCRAWWPDMTRGVDGQSGKDVAGQRYW
jgi:hypothetical protein